MEVSNHKIVISYHDSKTLQLVEYSLMNPSNYRKILLKDILKHYPNIISNHSIQISKDGCSLAALFSVSPDKPESLYNFSPVTTKAINTPLEYDIT